MRDQTAIDRAKSLRLAQTPPETRLWLALRARRFQGVKFRRQKVIGPYIADFACRDPMLVIELDGDSHGTQIAHDARRTAFLEMQGYRVIRFTNAEVMRNLEGVLEAIGQLVGPSPNPLP
ncbi:endonuclease domain-containing protein [Rhizorhapis sp. SPR117]|uniref:endonuclease domain-containing protein n=1 Tax=Rhizorhapis sp. SPR117 TaxID=2912611 RepID=UPI001F298A1A|nr:endonuclease domain-containing protein [Rhizorhapis sp. SPR117]